MIKEKYLDYRVSHKKCIDKKLLVGPAHGLKFKVFKFIWIQYTCKFYLVYHLIDLDASLVTAVFQRRMCFSVCKFSRKTAVSDSHCFRNSSLTIIWNNLGFLIAKVRKGIYILSIFVCFCCS